MRWKELEVESERSEKARKPREKYGRQVNTAHGWIEQDTLEGVDALGHAYIVCSPDGFICFTSPINKVGHSAPSYACKTLQGKKPVM